MMGLVTSRPGPLRPGFADQGGLETWGAMGTQEPGKVGVSRENTNEPATAGGKSPVCPALF